MNTLLHRISIIVATIVLALLCCLFVTPAVHAQDVITTTNTSGVQTTTVASGDQALPAPTAVSSPAPTSQEDTIFGVINPTNWDWWLRVLSALLLSAIGAWAIYKVFHYVTEIQKKYYDVTKDLASRGQTTSTEIVSSSFAAPARAPAAEGMPSAAPASVPVPKKLSVKGPQTVTVNVESTDFTAFFVQNGKEEPADNTVTWHVVPETAAVLSQSTGPVVRVTARQLGAFDLLVKPADASATGSLDVHFPVAVIAPAKGGISLPFIGEGWGTIVLAILFGIIIALLGLSRVLSTALVGTLLGALLGYIFGTVSPGRAGGDQRPASPAAPPSTGTNPPAGGNG